MKKTRVLLTDKAKQRPTGCVHESVYITEFLQTHTLPNFKGKVREVLVREQTEIIGPADTAPPQLCPLGAITQNHGAPPAVIQIQNINKQEVV